MRPPQNPPILGGWEGELRAFDSCAQAIEAIHLASGRNALSPGSTRVPYLWAHVVRRRAS
jgi:hypothetical protein